MTFREFILQMKEVQDRLNEYNITVELTDAARKWLAKEGYDPAFGARPLRRAIQKHVESPLSIECRLFQIVPHGSGPLAANYIIGEVVYFHVATRLLQDGALDARRVDYIARMGSDWYARANGESMFEMPRPPRVEKYPGGSER